MGQELAPAHVRVGVVEPGITRTELPDKGDGDTPDLDSLGELGVLDAAFITCAVVCSNLAHQINAGTAPPRVTW